MNLPVVLLQGAEVELQALYSHFEERREGSGDAFLAAVEFCLSQIAVFPKSAPFYIGRIRRQIVHRSAYGLFFEATGTRILVLAVLDLRQEQQSIRRRLQQPDP